MKSIKEYGRLFLEIEKIKGYINIAKKAGYVIIGGEKITKYTKKMYLLLYDKTAQKNTLKIVEKVKEKGVKVLSIENLDKIMNIDRCKLIAIKNKNISDIIINLIND